MAGESNAVEQAVARTLRDNLEKIQRSADELHQAVNDMVSACSSSRPSNALPPMIRAQTAAASLSATLEVLSRFVTSALQPAVRVPFEPEMPLPSMGTAPAGQPAPASSHLRQAGGTSPVPEHPRAQAPPRPVAAPPAMEPTPQVEPVVFEDPAPTVAAQPVAAARVSAKVESREAEPLFSLDSLPPAEQELHRRAYRVAKVSMQDIKLLRPEEVRLGRENKDLCIRLRDEIEKAHKEYDRRFQAIQSHPVDYFYDWMVEILGGGDPQALGEYPYRSSVLRR